MDAGVTARPVAQGSGWRVFRVGRSFCVSVDRLDAEEPAEIWLRRDPNDVVRGSLLGALVAGVHGAVDRKAAIEVMGAEWREVRKA